MNRIFALVEQLDLALDQLQLGTPVAGRFALILVDNAVELVLHTSCETEVRLDRSRGRLLPPRFDAKTSEAALGQAFGPKVLFCEHLAILDRTEGASIRSYHSYRNELYHAGVRHDPIIVALATEYFALAADVLPRIRVPAYLMADTDSPRAAKHFTGDMWSTAPEGRIRQAAESLRAQCPGQPKPFAETLADFATELIERVEHNLDFLASANPNGWDLSRVLVEVQLLHHAFHDPAGPQLGRRPRPPGETIFSALDAIRRTWNPPFGRSPVSSWKRRAIRLRSCATSHEALARFESLRRDMFYLSEIVNDAASDLEAEIDLRLGG